METGLAGSKPEESVGRILQKFKYSDGSYTKALVRRTFAVCWSLCYVLFACDFICTSQELSEISDISYK